MSPLMLATILSLALVQAAPKKSSSDVAPVPEGIEIALARVRALLELDPDDPAALEEYSTLLGKQGDGDGQLAYLIGALDAYDRTDFDDAKAKEKKLKQLVEGLTALDRETAAIKESRDAYLKDLTFAMQLYAGNQKKPKNGLDVAARILRYRPSHSAAKAAVDEILKKESGLAREAARLLSLGEVSRPRTFLVRWAEQHREWQKAGRVETDGYLVRSNAGYDVLNYTARGLEQISSFYTAFYGSNKQCQVGKTEVCLCRTRAEWVAESQKPDFTSVPGMMAFLDGRCTETISGSTHTFAQQFRVLAFDPRDLGRPLDSLWPTLWHEASHQYMQLAARMHNVPLWLNEGMASYFEGARVSADGRVSVGLPSVERLRDIFDVLATEEHALEPTLRGEGLLTGRQYAVAWGLVYYLRHGTGPAGKPKLRELLSHALETASQNNIDGYSLFEQTVLSPLGQDFSTFEKEWSAAIKALFTLESKPEVCARHHVEHAEEALAAQRFDEAREACTDALLRAPDDPTALLLAARIERACSQLARDKNAALKDETLLWARRAHQAALVSGDTAVESKAAEIAKSMDPAGFERVSAAERAYRKSVEKLVQKRIELGKPRAALAIAGRYLDDVLGDHREETLAAELRAKGTLRLERILRIFDGQTLTGLSASQQRFRIENGELLAQAQRPQAGEVMVELPRAPLFVETPLAPLFRFEGEAWLENADLQLALTFSQPAESGAHGFTLRPHATAGETPLELIFPPYDLLERGNVGQIQEAFLPELGAHDFETKDPQKLPPTITAKRWMRFALVRDALDTLRLEIDGQLVATRKIQPFGDEAHVGLFVWGGRAKLRGLRAVELDRL